MLLFRIVGTFNPVLRMIKTSAPHLEETTLVPLGSGEKTEREQQTHSNYRRLHTKHQFLVRY